MSKILLGLAVAGLVALSGCSISTGSDDSGGAAPVAQTSKKSTPSITAVKIPESTIGGTLELKPRDGEIKVTLKSAVIHSDQGENDLLDPGKQMVEADMAIEVISGTYAANPLSFAFAMTDGRREMGIIPWLEGSLPALDMQAGQNLAGLVRFIIPEGQASGGRIALVDEGPKDIGYWVFG